MSQTQSQASAPTLRADQLTCIRGNRVVFSGLSFEIEPGSLTILRGPNGAGKSSLLRVLATLLQPAAGRLVSDGQDIAKDREDYRRRIRYVGHLDAVKPVLTVGENLTHWAAIYGARVAAAEVSAALAAMGLEGLDVLPARFLSAGQRRRLGLARLLLSPGHIWLLDEPTVSLDAASIARLETAIRDHIARGGSAVIATHNDLDLSATRVLNLEPAAAIEEADV